MRTPLVRPYPRVVAGVCQGIAQHLGWDIRWVRIGFVLSNVFGGAGILLYLWCWLLCPNAQSVPATTASQDGAQQPPRSTNALLMPPREAQPHSAAAFRRWVSVDSGTLWLILAIGISAIVGLLIAAQLGVNVPLPVAVPFVVAGIGVLASWTMLRDVTVARAASAITLVVLATLIGGAIFFLHDPTLSTSLAVSAIIVGAMLLAAGTVPWIVQLVRRSADLKAAQAVETTRLEVAAHLHDSVLQTLALIQQRSEPESDVSRIAHSQEQSLRQWLFSADQPAGGTLQQQIADTRKTLEAQFPVRFDVVTIGDDEPGEVTNIVAAATAEAMRNAAAHAGGTVSIYAEGNARVTTVSVTDRGPGVDLSAIPPHHFGIRESIIARAERAGGSAIYTRGPGGQGTAVTISVPQSAPTADRHTADHTANSAEDPGSAALQKPGPHTSSADQHPTSGHSDL